MWWVTTLTCFGIELAEPTFFKEASRSEHQRHQRVVLVYITSTDHVSTVTSLAYYSDVFKATLSLLPTSFPACFQENLSSNGNSILVQGTKRNEVDTRRTYVAPTHRFIAFFGSVTADSCCIGHSQAPPIDPSAKGPQPHIARTQSWYYKFKTKTIHDEKS